jgi:pimeloyl-ACP methyl ester carboxylesterase
MRPEEALALGDVAGKALSTVGSHVGGVHRGIARRVFDSIGPSGAPVRLAHDAIAGGVYAVVERSLVTAARAGGLLVSLRRTEADPSIQATPAGRTALGALNGAFGDEFERHGSVLALPMTLRVEARDVDPEPAAVAEAFPSAQGRLAVFLHGLCETEETWTRRAGPAASYGERLHAELGYTPVYVRYNSGRHISSNGRALGDLLERLHAAWAVPVEEIALIGHSMGGLLARSACHYHGGSAWASKVRHVFMLGAPHRGAPLELAVYAAGAALSRLPETRALAAALDRRSAGIKDLGRGYIVEEDWREHDPEAFLTRTGQEVPFLRSANHYFVSASVSGDAEAALGRIVGDMLVLRASAWAHGGRGERLRFPVGNYAHVAGANHMDLVAHPSVYAQLARWLGAGRLLPRALPALPAGPLIAS